MSKSHGVQVPVGNLFALQLREFHFSDLVRASFFLQISILCCFLSVRAEGMPSEHPQWLLRESVTTLSKFLFFASGDPGSVRNKSLSRLLLVNNSSFLPVVVVGDGWLNPGKKAILGFS